MGSLDHMLKLFTLFSQQRWLNIHYEDQDVCDACSKDFTAFNLFAIKQAQFEFSNIVILVIF